MDVTDRVKKVLTDFSALSPNHAELIRLEEFLRKMKEAGVAKTREYDLPLPDTLGRALVDHAPKSEQG
jgi:hypothetical protein